MASTEDGTIAPIQMLEIMWQMDHAMQARSKRMQKTMGVTGPQRVVLRKLDADGTLSAAELASALHLHPSTLTGIVQRLEASGYVSRRKDAADSRRVLLSLTAEGKKLARREPGSIEQIVGDVLAQSTPEEIRSAARLLRRISAALG
jgi:MarR family transcriptional regulator, organic hydroperoxide resistance regulator